MKRTKNEEKENSNLDLLQLADEMEKLGGGINVLKEKTSLLCYLGNRNRALNFRISGNTNLVLSPDSLQEKAFTFDDIFQEEEEVFNYFVRETGENKGTSASLLTYFQKGFNVSLISHSSEPNINVDELLHIELLLFCIFENSQKEENKFCFSLSILEYDVDNSAEVYRDLLMGEVSILIKINMTWLSLIIDQTENSLTSTSWIVLDNKQDLEVIVEDTKKLLEIVELPKAIALLRLGLLNKKQDSIINSFRILLVNERFLFDTKPNASAVESSREASRLNEWKSRCVKELNILLSEASRCKLVSKDKLELVLHKKTKFAKLLLENFLSNTKGYFMADISSLGDLNKIHSLLAFQQR